MDALFYILTRIFRSRTNLVIEPVKRFIAIWYLLIYLKYEDIVSLSRFKQSYLQ